MAMSRLKCIKINLFLIKKMQTNNEQREQALQDFGNRLKLIRKSKKETQLSLADKLGMQRGRINNWEHGLTYPTGVNLEKLCSFFGVSSEYLLYGRGGDSFPQISVSHYPLIEWSQVFDFKQFTGGEYDSSRQYIADADKFNKDCFVLKIISEAMNGLFPVGAYTFFEPCDTAKAGDYVLVTKGTLYDFKQLSQDSFNLILKPLNPAFAAIPMQQDIKIIARAVKVVMVI